MAISQITYTNKVSLNENASVPDINKVKADDMNEIKSVVNGNSQVLNNTALIGEIKAYAGTTLPTGYLYCDGTAVSRTDYADLFNVIGTTYGNGDGSTTFNLPDLGGRVPVGLHYGETEFLNLGQSGGEKTHTLTVGEMPEHNHAMNNYSGGGNKNQFHTVNEFYSYHGDQSYWNYNNPNVWTSKTGSNQAHNNLQPYLVVHYIIRATY